MCLSECTECSVCHFTRLSPSLSLSEDAVLTGPKKVDVEAVPTIGGQSIFEIDLDSADKPWRLPGVYIYCTTEYTEHIITIETYKLVVYD